MGNLILAIILSAVLAVLARLRRSITTAAAILAGLFSVCITYFGGIPAFLALVATLVFAVISGNIYPSRRKKKSEIGLKHGQRDIWQIICNVFIGALMILCYGIFGKPVFLVCYGAAMAATLADSMASEIGILSTRPAVDIMSRKPIQSGLSGGVTPLGIFASVIGAIIIAAIFAPASGLGAWAFTVISLSGFCAALFDSILGSTLQVKYRCSKCSAITEKPIHCGAQGQECGGISFITNDVINLLNNIFSVAFAAVLILIGG